MEELYGKKGVLIHHWDTDGICSAALFLRELDGRADVDTFTPVIGNFYLNTDDREFILKKEPDFIVVLDMALPPDSIEFLTTLGEVYIFDHHLQKPYSVKLHHNPIIAGESAEKYPSASWVVSDFLGHEADMLSILGSVGDREKKLLDNHSAMETVHRVLHAIDADFDTLMDVVSLLDSSYKIGHRQEVQKLPWFMMEQADPKGVLQRNDLRENLVKLESAIESEVDDVKEVAGILYLEMDSPYNIISTVTRKIAWANEDKIVVVINDSFIEGSIQVYMRGPIADTRSIIELSREKGYSAGGKSDVVGMVVPAEDREFIEKAMEML